MIWRNRKQATKTDTSETDPLAMDIPQAFPSPIETPSKAKMDLMRLQNRKNGGSSPNWLVPFGLILMIVIGGYYWLEHYEIPQLKEAIESATWAPNHHVTEPWHFYHLGPQAIDALSK